jgi:RNA polymerase sigma factor (sigma-70 family)
MTSQVSRREWFRTMIAQYEQRLVRYARRITGNHESARDVVQDAYLRLWNLDGEVPENITAWLFQVCRNRALDVLRKDKKMIHMTADDMAMAGCQPEPEETGLGQELKRLPENQQEVIRLKFQEGLSYREISEVTGLSVSNVGYLLHIGIKNLRDAMTSRIKTGTKAKGGAR